RKFTISDSVLLVNPNYLAANDLSEQYPYVKLKYVDDKRDVRAFPLNGYKVQAEIANYGLGSWGTSRFWKYDFSISFYKHLHKSWYAAGGLYNYGIVGNKIPYYEKQFIGFVNFIRGYENYVVDASNYALLKTEIKYAIFPRKIVHFRYLPRKFQDFPIGVFLAAFGDVGYAIDNTFNNQDNTLKNKVLSGGGLGIQGTFIYDTVFRFESNINQFGKINWELNFVISIR
ncbi:MAG: BamA/TamA family outer membrane protein, partial [Bacteroidia bacterium]|nr:BamA/TamA family outer membrane protein [Bacteroidia bacterium]